MNRIKNILFAALVAVATLVAPSCNKDNSSESEQQTITISLVLSSYEVSFIAEGGIADINVVTNAESWDFVNATSWAEVERTESGITIYAPENTSNTTRKGDIVIVASTGTTVKEKTITIEQVERGGTTSGGELTFECPVFEQLMLSLCDFDGDGIISTDEAALVTDLTLTLDENSDSSQEPITSLKGIKNFVNLVNLDCDGNLLTELDLSGLEKLEYLDCCYNKIKTLNISGCKALQQVYCYMNEIETVLHDGCDNLAFFQADKNRLTTLDMSNKPNLVYLDVLFNSLREVKIDNCPKLQIAAVGNNSLTSLSLKGLPELSSLGCHQNNIATLDLSELPKLSFLECYTNNLATLDLSANAALTYVACQNNLISDLKFDNCITLHKIECSNNRLTGSLDLNKHPSLTSVKCGGNKLSAISATACTALTELSCANTSITALDVTTLSLLESLIANDCLLTTMDCSNNNRLSTLYLQGNPLTSLILAKGQSIADMKVDNYDVISYK